MARTSRSFTTSILMHFASAAVLGAALASPAYAQEAVSARAQEVRRAFDIPAQSLASAIIQFSRQSDVVVTAPATLTRGKTAQTVKGTMPPREALQRLIEETGLRELPTHNGGFILEAAPRPPPRSGDDVQASATSAIESKVTEVVITAQTTRSVTKLGGPQIQEILPGVSPMRAIQTLPGVNYTTADPWGNVEQNVQLWIHGFDAQALGYTLDNVPLGDQSYGNYNGLSPQRAVISEDVETVLLSTGAASLATASTSNLGGAIETFSAEPSRTRGVRVSQTLGSYDVSRTYARIDTGEFGAGNTLSLSGVRHRARAWDFDGVQGGDQFNAKFVHDDSVGKLTLFFDYSDKTEPNEDATAVAPFIPYQPYTKPFFYPNFQAALNYLSPTGATPPAEGLNYRNYYSAAQRTDYLAYAKYDWRLGDKVTWSNQAYYHNDDGVGIIAGPLSASGLPSLFALYFPGQDLKVKTGNSGYVTRTTEYENKRYGLLSTVKADVGDHAIQFGAWYENNDATQYRRWYPLDVNNPSTPYQRPRDPLFTQFGLTARYDVLQLHLQDRWQVTPELALQAGFKSSLQWAEGRALVQPILGSLPGSSGFPEGKIDSREWFLPQFGATWDVTPTEQVFANVQKNLRQFVTGGALTPWNLGSQQAFDLFKSEVEPETSWTYEAGVRTRRQVSWGPLTGIEAQINYYHVDFANRLLLVNDVPGGLINGNVSIIRNVGGVKTDGVDAAMTARFGKTFSLYNALSYNHSIYQDDYRSGASTIATAGKNVPASPSWLNKTVATLNVGRFNVQAIGDYVGKRYATYTNDLSVPSTFQLSGRIGFDVPLSARSFVKSANLSLNVTNITQERATSSLIVISPSDIYYSFPMAPRQWFLTLSLGI